MPNKITTIFFDLFGVLIGINQSVFIQYLSKFTGMPYLKVKEIVRGETLMRLERNEIDFPQYIKDISLFFPRIQHLDVNILRDYWKDYRIGELPPASLLEVLQKNYEVWVLSNTTISHIKSLQSKFIFFKHVNGIITSESAGFYKPDPQIFRFALAKANTVSSSVLFIDDNRENTKSAESLGIVSHCYTRFDKFINFINVNLQIQTGPLLS